MHHPFDELDDETAWPASRHRPVRFYTEDDSSTDDDPVEDTAEGWYEPEPGRRRGNAVVVAACASSVLALIVAAASFVTASSGEVNPATRALQEVAATANAAKEVAIAAVDDAVRDTLDLIVQLVAAKEEVAALGAALAQAEKQLAEAATREDAALGLWGDALDQVRERDKRLKGWEFRGWGYKARIAALTAELAQARAVPEAAPTRETGQAVRPERATPSMDGPAPIGSDALGVSLQ